MNEDIYKDLKLIPIQADSRHTASQYWHTTLACKRKTELNKEIIDSGLVREQDFPGSCFFKQEYMLVKELMQFKNSSSVLGNTTNKAIWTYLECLLGKMPVILYWS